MTLKTQKKLDSERDPNHQQLALRARSFQALKLALRARFRAQTTSLRSASGLTLGRETPKKNAAFPTFFLLKMSRSLKFFFLRLTIFLGLDSGVSSKNTWISASLNFKRWVQIVRYLHFFELLFSFFFLFFSLFFVFFRGSVNYKNKYGNRLNSK